MLPALRLRSIVVGTIWRRLCSKLAVTSVNKEMTVYLGNHQFGVGIPCGAEGILHSVNRLIELKGDQNNLTMLLVDFTNSFNLVDRTILLAEVRIRRPSIIKWVELCYSRPARLYYNEFILSSSKGVQQGDPLWTLLFALILHPLVNKIATQCKLQLYAWYLDDNTIIGDTSEVAKALNIIQAEGSSVVYISTSIKRRSFGHPLIPGCLEDGVFPRNISSPALGVKLLGGPVSLNHQYCNDIVLSHVDKTIHLMNAVKSLKDPQRELLLLRNCTGVSRLYFTMCTTRPKKLQAAAMRLDQHLLQYLQQLITGDDVGFGPVQQRFATLPIRDGGLGVYTMASTSLFTSLQFVTLLFQP